MELGGGSDVAGKRVISVVLNDVLKDARVIKEAKSLQAAGFDVEIFGISQNDYDLQRLHDGLVINLISIKKAAEAGVARARRRTGRMIFFLAAAMALIGLAAAVALEVMAGVTILVVTYLIGLVTFGLIVWRRRAGLRTKLLELFANMQHYARFPRSIDPSAPAPGSRWSLKSRLFAPISHSQHEWVDRIEAYAEKLAASIAKRGSKIDIVHCHDATTLRVGEILKKKWPRIRVVYDTHELFSAVVGDAPVKARWLYELEQRAHGFVDAVVTVNDSIAGVLERYHPKLPKPVVVCNATPRPEPGLAGDGRLHKAAKLDRKTKILLFQGGFAKFRGLELVTQAAAMLPEGWALVHMGWGTLKPELEQMAALVDPDGKRIRFVPPVAQSELAQWTADATIGVILYEPHSLNHVFCSPNKLWEYPRSGVPVLVSDAPEMVQRIEQHGYGWILPKEDLSPHRIARFIANLSEEEIAAAKARCYPFLEKDNWSVYEARLLEIYARLAA